MPESTRAKAAAGLGAFGAGGLLDRVIVAIQEHYDSPCGEIITA